MNPGSDLLRKTHGFKDFLYWNLVLAVPILIACIAIGQQTVAGLMFYLLLCLVGTGLIYRFFCTHCPHYARSQGGVKCMFFWKMPKFFPARSGPLNLSEKIITVTATILVLGIPVSWLLQTPGLLIIYLLSLTVFGVSVRRNECGRCIYFDCPSNCAPKHLQPDKLD